jgi:protein TonB
MEACLLPLALGDERRMTGGPTHRIDVVAAREQGDPGDLSNVTPLAAERAETASPAPAIAVTNVIPFVRPRRAGLAGSASELMLDPAERPAPPLLGRERRAQILALLALSLAAHSGLYLLFNREPEPMASIGLEAISVEIVLGANMPAGPAPTPSNQELRSAPPHDVPTPIDADTSIAKIEETSPTPVPPAPQTQRLAETAAADVAPDLPQVQTAEPRPAQPERKESALLRPEETAVLSEPELMAAREEPKATPAEPEKPEPVKTETGSEPNSTPDQDRKKRQEARPKRERPAPQKAASRQPNSSQTPPSSAGGVGLGRSRIDSNYRGLVAAHLARHKRFPPEARSRGEQGGATVSFALDGGGRVTRVSLVRGTGSATLDQEATAMVRRASPFPAPPDGRSANFTVPVSFRIQ